MSLQEDDRPVAASDTSAPPPDLVGHAASLAREVCGLVHDHLELATLESRLFIGRVLWMASIAVFSALVLASAWLVLTGAAVLVLISVGVAPAMAMTLLAATNVLLALVGWLLLRRTSARLGWPATQRKLRPLAACP
ncbi:hypothetical protein [Lentisalinibacter orientalis]|uniref:hypothetical protein n=1 Tax=Lentisalinibacter orientalis TaxID=2992241 RepID=UPI00386ADA40